MGNYYAIQNLYRGKNFWNKIPQRGTIIAFSIFHNKANNKIIISSKNKEKFF